MNTDSNNIDEIMRSFGIDREAIARHVRDCPHDHYSNGDCVLPGSHPLFDLLNGYRRGEIRVDENQLARDLYEALKALVDEVEQTCIPAQQGLEVANLFDAQRISDLSARVRSITTETSRLLQVVHGKELAGQPGALFWSPAIAPRGAALAGACARAHDALCAAPFYRDPDALPRVWPLGVRAGDHILEKQLELLKSAMRSTATLAERSAEPPPAKKDCGRPRKSDPGKDAKIARLWKESGIARYRDFARVHGLDESHVRKALERNRKVRAGSVKPARRPRPGRNSRKSLSNK